MMLPYGSLKPVEWNQPVTFSPPHSSRPRATAERQSFLSGIMDGGRFLRQWAGNPLGIGAIVPSSPHLAEAMAGFIDPDRDGPVVELGPGTGVVTKAILNQGVAADRLTSIEYCEDFARLLRTRFKDVSIVRGDAYDLAASLGQQPPLAAVVSSLPLFTSPPAKRRALIIDALDRLAPGAPFIQFSYALVAPVKEERGLFTVSTSGWIWNNMPPARVWIYRKSVSPLAKEPA